MNKIDFGRVSVPLDQFASQGNAVLGIRGSGKSYTGTYCAERLLDGGVPIVALDPIGIWRYLRVPADAKSKGYPVVVCGGQHADIPLTVAGAEDVMRAAMKSGVSVIFDLYDIALSKRDWRDIVTAVVRVLLYENKSYGLRHIFIEEAAEFVPQRISPDQGVVYGVVERLVRMGGNAQLGVTLINQRAEELNKAVLDLCDLLVLHRQKGRNSLTNLGHWLDVASVTTAKEAAARVPLLKNGEAFVWEAESDTPTLTKIPQKRTFHPDRRQLHHVEERVAAEKVDVASFVERVKSELEKAKPEVVGVDKARGADSSFAVLHASKAELAAEYQRGSGDGYARGVHSALEKLDPFINGLRHFGDDFMKAIATLENERQQAGTLPVFGASVVSRPEYKAAQREANRDARDAAEGISKADRALLTVLAQRAGSALTKERLAILAGYSPNAGHFTNVVGGLRKRVYVTPGWPIAITSEGMKALGGFEALPTGGALFGWWCDKLATPERRLLEAAYRSHPHGLTKQELAVKAGYEPSAGHFTNVLGKMRTMGLLTGRREIKASEAFFA